MIEVKLLYDPVTKRCCKKRVTNTINQMGGEWGSFLLTIQKSFNERLRELEEKTDVIMSNCVHQISNRMVDCNKRMDEIHRTVQDQILQAYVPLANQAEEILAREYAPTQEPTSTPTLAKENTPTPTQVPTDTPSSSSEYVPSKVELPSTPKTTGKVPCLEIDLCDGLYARLKQFGEWVQNIMPMVSIVLANASGKPTPDTPDNPRPPSVNAPYGAEDNPLPEAAGDAAEVEGGG